MVNEKVYSKTDYNNMREREREMCNVLYKSIYCHFNLGTLWYSSYMKFIECS